MSLALETERPVVARHDASTPVPAAHAGEYLSFRIGSEEYALGILHVQEIRSYEAPTRMAGAPDCVKGVVNLRGVIVPVVDLRRVLGLGDPRCDNFTVVIVLNVLQRVVGLVVDSVSDVVELADGQIRPVPDLHCTSSAGFISGLATLPPPPSGGGDARDRLLILADIERLLSAPEVGLAHVTSAPH